LGFEEVEGVKFGLVMVLRATIISYNFSIKGDKNESSLYYLNLSFLEYYTYQLQELAAISKW